MRLGWSVFVVALVAGCHPGMGDDYPIKPGGDDQTVTPGRMDAAIPDGNDATARIAGRACLVADMRNLTACAATGAGGLVVTIGTQTATTAVDGTFTIPTPTGTNLTWAINGTGIVKSLMPFGAVATIPVVSSATYDNLLISNGLILVAGQGSVVVKVVRSGAPLVGAIATATPTPIYAPYYDGTNATTWNQNATGAFGVIWIPGAGGGTLTVRVTPPLGNLATASVPVGDQALTFATLVVP